MFPSRSCSHRRARPSGRQAEAIVEPFANEPVLELRRAEARARLPAALAAVDARLPLRVPVWIGDSRRDGEDISSTDPSAPSRLVGLAAAARPA